MKNKNTAAFFALFLGWFGVHRFYLRQPGLGILYIILLSTTISFLLGIIDAIVLLNMDQEEFDRKYNNVDYNDEEHDRYRSRRERRDFRRSNRRRSTTRTRENRTQSVRPRAEYKRRETRERRKPAKNQVPQRKRINPYKQSGIKKYKDFDLQAAIEDFDKGLEMEPRDISLHFNIACAYSLTEQADKALAHLAKAVEYGLKDFNKIKTHDDLAYVRIQPKFEEFEANGFKEKAAPQQIEAPKENLLDDDLLLSQLNRLGELKNKNLITEKEFLAEKQKLMR